MAEKAAFKAIVHGRVQGVFFRNSTQRKARDLACTGTVRNLRGGTSVEVIAEGEKENLDTLVTFIEKGPPGARVNSIDIEWTEYTGGYTGFEIIYRIDR